MVCFLPLIDKHTHTHTNKTKHAPDAVAPTRTSTFEHCVTACLQSLRAHIFAASHRAIQKPFLKFNFELCRIINDKNGKLHYIQAVKARIKKQ